MYPVDMYLRVRQACMVEGMSVREPSRVFGLHRDTVRKMLAYSVPSGYRRKDAPPKPKLFTVVIDAILDGDGKCPASTRFAELPSISFAGSPPLTGPAAEPRQTGSWGRRIPV